MISPYSIPALLAFLAKLVIFYYSRRALLQTTETRIFRLAILASLVMNVAEFVLLQKFSYQSTYVSVITYYAVSTLLVASVLHLAIAISFENWNSDRLLPVYAVVYGSALALSFMFIFLTSALITEIQDFRGYSATIRPGPFYWIEEIFVAFGLVGSLILPLFGLRSSRIANRRSQCKLWIAVASPLVLLVIAVIVLRHMDIRWFNITVTSPPLITLLLAGVGYAIHNSRIIELDFYIPWSRARKVKTKLYQNLNDLGHELRRVPSFQALLDRVAEVLQCPVALVSNFNLALASAGADKTVLHFPVAELADIERVTVINEISERQRSIRGLMVKHRVAAIIPLFPYSRSISFWLLCGEPFGQRVYSVLDFKILQRLLERLSGLLLDKVMQLDPEVHTQNPLERPGTGGQELQTRSEEQKRECSEKTLQDRIAELEANCIKAALLQTEGNKAEAARLLGLRPNTLHYKMRRYRIA